MFCCFDDDDAMQTTGLAHIPAPTKLMTLLLFLLGHVQLENCFLQIKDDGTIMLVKCLPFFEIHSKICWLEIMGSLDITSFAL